MVESLFLESIMKKMKFSSNLVELIMRFIFTATLSMIINGVPTGLITLERGLRQGYPFSPYFFIICVGAFSNLLVRAKKDQLIQGLKFAKDVSITHLLFTEDSIIFS